MCMMYLALRWAVANGEKKVLSKFVLLIERKRRPGVALVVEEASQPVAEQPEMSREAPGDHNLCTSQEQRYTNEECSRMAEFVMTESVGQISAAKGELSKKRRRTTIQFVNLNLH